MARDHGIRFAGILAGKYRRNPGKSLLDNLKDIPTTLLNARDVGLSTAGVAQSLKILREFRPDVVFAKGGFVALPVATAAKILGIPVVAHESDVSPGIGSKAVSKWAKVMAVGFPTELYGDQLGDRLQFTGNPVRPEILKGDPKKGLRHAFGSGTTKADPVLLVVGGSQGAQSVNDAVLKGLSELTKDYRVIHVAGQHNQAEAESHAKDLKIPATRYRALGFVEAAVLADLYAASDLVVSRAGANTIAELAALRKPVILIPNSQMAAHQVVNARRLDQAGAVELMLEENLTPNNLLKTVGKLCHDNKKLKRLGDKLATFNVPDAADKLAQTLMEQAH